jgi:hypothetical protein
MVFQVDRISSGIAHDEIIIRKVALLLKDHKQHRQITQGVWNGHCSRHPSDCRGQSATAKCPGCGGHLTVSIGAGQHQTQSLPISSTADKQPARLIDQEVKERVVGR